jgi:hypothetical protein
MRFSTNPQIILTSSLLFRPPPIVMSKHHPQTTLHLLISPSPILFSLYSQTTRLSLPTASLKKRHPSVLPRTPTCPLRGQTANIRLWHIHTHACTRRRTHRNGTAKFGTTPSRSPCSTHMNCEPRGFFLLMSLLTLSHKVYDGSSSSPHHIYRKPRSACRPFARPTSQYRSLSHSLRQIRAVSRLEFENCQGAKARFMPLPCKLSEPPSIEYGGGSAERQFTHET